MILRFKYGWSVAERDKAIFTDWERGNIEAYEAMQLVCKNNGVRQISTVDFVRLANSLGYRRENGNGIDR